MLAEVEKIKREVGKKYGVSSKEIDGPSREKRIARARFEAMARVRTETECSYPEIGFYFGRRDHSTVIYACKIYNKYPKRFSQGWK